MKSAVSAIVLKWSVLVLLLVSGGADAQKHGATGFPTPPSPSDHPSAEQSHTTRPRPQMDFLAMERESKELSELAQSIPGDVDLIKKGLVPKDVIEKLKRIEKLSKHLRGEVAF